MKLTDEMHEAVANSHVGKYLDRLIREDYERRGNSESSFNGNVIQALWDAFMSGREGKSFREIKASVASVNGGVVSGEK